MHLSSPGFTKTKYSQKAGTGFRHETAGIYHPVSGKKRGAAGNCRGSEYLKRAEVNEEDRK